MFSRMPALTAVALAASLGGASFTHATTNLALLGDGASFVAASSASPLATPASVLATMQDDVISATPTPWYHGDSRYTFAPHDMNQWIEIKLGSLDDLSSLAATFSVSNRTVTGPFTAEVSTDGSVFHPFGSGYTFSKNKNIGTDTITVTMPMLAEYIIFGFGPTDAQYHDGGSAIRELFAFGGPSTVPEPSVWALMLVGVAAVGALGRTRRRACVTSGAAA